jgi:hypothetical protein
MSQFSKKIDQLNQEIEKLRQKPGNDFESKYKE